MAGEVGEGGRDERVEEGLSCCGGFGGGHGPLGGGRSEAWLAGNIL